MLILEDMDQHASAREHQIIQVAKSINELAQIFKELNVLVIEQVFFFFIYLKKLFSYIFLFNIFF